MGKDWGINKATQPAVSDVEKKCNSVDPLESEEEEILSLQLEERVVLNKGATAVKKKNKWNKQRSRFTVLQ